MDILNFILENATVKNVQDGVKQFNVRSIAYTMKSQILLSFPEFRGNDLNFGLKISEIFEPFKTDSILANEINHKIVKLQHKMKMYGKWHNDYKGMVVEHDMLVLLNNKLNEPITEFIKLYKKAQKNKGKKISVVKKKELNLPKPI